MASGKVEKKGKSVRVIRHVYLYLVTLIGLITFVMGAVGIINNGLQRYVFKVDQIENFGPVAVYPGYQDQCSMAYPDPKDKEGKTTITPTSQETADCRVAAQEQSRHFSDAQFARELSISLAQIAIGLPIWLFHWGVIQGENRKKRDED